VLLHDMAITLQKAPLLIQLSRKLANHWVPLPPHKIEADEFERPRASPRALVHALHGGGRSRMGAWRGEEARADDGTRCFPFGRGGRGDGGRGDAAEKCGPEFDIADKREVDNSAGRWSAVMTVAIAEQMPRGRPRRKAEIGDHEGSAEGRVRGGVIRDGPRESAGPNARSWVEFPILAYFWRRSLVIPCRRSMGNCAPSLQSRGPQIVRQPGGGHGAGVIRGQLMNRWGHRAFRHRQTWLRQQRACFLRDRGGRPWVRSHPAQAVAAAESDAIVATTTAIVGGSRGSSGASRSLQPP
jgi:hypothetical protein